MREEILDILKHTYGLGIITELRVTGDDDGTLIETMDENQRVVIKGKLKTALPQFKGEFGIGNLPILKGLVEFANYRTDNATVEVKVETRNEKALPVEIIFKDENGKTPGVHRLMSPELVAEQFEFVGAEWNVEFVPSKNKIDEFKYMAVVYGQVESLFMVNTKDGALQFNLGENGGVTLDMGLEDEAEFGSEHRWPIAEVLSVLKLDEGNALVSILDDPRMAALQISISSKFADWIYIFPAIKV